MKIAKYIALSALLSCSLCGMAQEHNIAITPMMTDEVDIPAALCPTVEQKLLQIATVNGYGSRSQEFVLTANAVTVEKSAVPTVPPQVTLTIDMTLYVYNAAEQLIVDEYTTTLTGIGRNEKAAYASALKTLKPRTPAIRRFMAGVRDKIVSYYAERVPVLIAKADAYAARGEYDEAMEVLSAVPEAVPEYPDVASRMSGYYVQAIDREADRALQAAKSEMAQGNVESSLALLNSIDPLSTRFAEATTLINALLLPLPEEEKSSYADAVELHNEQKTVAAEAAQDDKAAADMALTASYARAAERPAETPQELKNRIKAFLAKENAR